MAEEEKAPKPEVEILGQLRTQGTKLRIYLIEGNKVEGSIEKDRRYDLLVQGEEGERYWIPKHSVIYAKLL